MRDNRGFTLIELMIVVVIIGILAAIAIPNFMSMQDRAREAKVKSHAHALQLTAEDFAVNNDGIYSDAGADLLPLLPGAALMTNAFTNQISEPRFAAAAQNPGEIGIVAVVQGGVAVGYDITGFGKAVNIIQLTNGF